MRFLRLFFLLTLLSTFLHSKDSHAGFENPVARGLVVSGGSFVGTGLGTVSGYLLVGLVYQDITGDESLESLKYAFLGASIGAGIGSYHGAVWSAKSAGANTRLVGRDTLITSVISSGAMIIGVFSENFVLFSVGVTVGLVGIVVAPVVAGISAAMNPEGDGVSISPVISPDYQGVVAGMRF